jgi:hypothetical protein
MWRAAAVHLDLRRDLAVEQGRWLVPGGVMLLSKSGPTDIRPYRCVPLDHMIGRQYP